MMQICASSVPISRHKADISISNLLSFIDKSKSSSIVQIAFQPGTQRNDVRRVKHEGEVQTDNSRTQHSKVIIMWVASLQRLNS